MAKTVVRLLVPMAGARAWNVGDEFECGATEAKRLIKAGVAAAIEGGDKIPVGTVQTGDAVVTGTVESGDAVPSAETADVVQATPIADQVDAGGAEPA